MPPARYTEGGSCAVDFLQNLPTWAVILLALLAAAVLVLLNIGWLLQAKAMLEGYARKPPASSRQQSATHRRDAHGNSPEARPDESPERASPRDDSH